MSEAIKISKTSKWVEVDITLVNNPETRIIGKANVSFNSETERPETMVIEGHSFERAYLTHDGKLSYRHMKECGNEKCQANARAAGARLQQIRSEGGR